jgi:hypothetical protein
MLVSARLNRAPAPPVPDVESVTLTLDLEAAAAIYHIVNRSCDYATVFSPAEAALDRVWRAMRDAGCASSLCVQTERQPVELVLRRPDGLYDPWSRLRP